jgi:hypothetical protein
LEQDLAEAQRDLAQADLLRRQVADAGEILCTLPAMWATFGLDDQRNVARMLSEILGGIRLEATSTSRDIKFADPPAALTTVYVCLQMSPLLSKALEASGSAP